MWPWWVKIPTEDFTDKTLVINDTYGDDVRGNDLGAGHGGWQGGATWWLNFWLMQLAPPDGSIYN